MKVTAQSNYILLKRYQAKSDSQFIDNTGSNESPFFITVSAGQEATGIREAWIVLPRPGSVMVIEADGEEQYWVKSEDIMGINNEQ